MDKNSKNNSLGEHIRTLRIAHGETQQTLGDYLGYGATTIANYESGYRLPDIRTLQKIAHHYNVTILDLL